MSRIFTLFYLLTLSFTAQCQTADFTYQSSNGLFCEPTTIQFNQTSTGNPTGFIWTFGNNRGSDLPNPATTYNLAGAYTVTLVVVYAQTTITVSKTIVINSSISLSLSYDRNYICIPGNINFTATSNGNISAYEWDFGDGSGIISNASNTINHNYTTFGNYSAKVKATDVNGCSKTISVQVDVKKPPVTGTVSPTSGCIPSVVNFNANVVLPVSGSVMGYTWDFGDGSPLSTTAINNTTHAYTAIGNYLPTLSIVTNEGCSNTYNFPAVAYGIPPVNHIAYPKKIIVCGSETPEFVSKAVNANSYFWDFGDGTTATVTDTITQHKYLTLGTKTITVTPYFNGCAGTTISFTIDVVGVISGYTYTNTCINPTQFSFNNTSQGNLSTILWSFGDASPTVNTLNPVHNYPPAGEFRTSLIVTDNMTGCADEYIKYIYTATPSLVNADSAICKLSNTTFSILNNYTNSAALYTWHVAGSVIGPNDSSTFIVNAGTLGNFNSNYVIIDNGTGYCPDTVQLAKPLLVKGPNVGFNSPNTICFKSPYIVTNTTQPFVPVDSIAVCYWNFGLPDLYDTTFQPAPYTDFLYPGTWDVTLYAIDKNGCKDSLHKIVTVNPIPFLNSVPAIDTLCQGRADTLIAFHSDNIVWSPAASLPCNTCDTIIVSPTVPSTYYVTATNNFNCSVTDSVLIKLYPPFTAIAGPANIYTCMNETVQLNVGPPSKIISWSPATGLSDPNIYSPIALPVDNTTYTATLTDSVGCFSSTATVTVHVKSLPTVDAGPDMVLPYNSNFSLNALYSNNVTTFLWEPAATLSCNNCAAPSGISDNTQTYTITVTSDSGCITKDAVTIFVECKNSNLLLPGAFTPNGDNLNDYFYPIARGIKQVIRFGIYNRQGQLVFEARDFAPNNRSYGWDGKLKGMPQGTGTYIYTIEAVCEIGQRLNKKGSFVLLR